LRLIQSLSPLQPFSTDLDATASSSKLSFRHLLWKVMPTSYFTPQFQLSCSPLPACPEFDPVPCPAPKPASPRTVSGSNTNITVAALSSIACSISTTHDPRSLRLLLPAPLAGTPTNPTSSSISGSPPSPRLWSNCLGPSPLAGQHSTPHPSAALEKGHTVEALSYSTHRLTCPVGPPPTGRPVACGTTWSSPISTCLTSFLTSSSISPLTRTSVSVWVRQNPPEKLVLSYGR
jgi:hypothetical protein